MSRFAPQCACATYDDGSVHSSLCPLHAELDPCEVFARVTGKRRTGTIRRGTCTHCGWKDRTWRPTSTWTRVPRGERYPLTIGKAYDLGTDPTDGAWAVICEQHSTLVGVDTRAEALSVRAHDFCDDCREEIAELARLVS